MPCNTCKMQFNLFKRKRSCISCHHFYCLNCLGRRRKNLCIRCEIIHSSTKNELMLLKTKDLIFFLQSRKINISGIVEKEELCNLIINHINSSSFGECSSSTSPDFDNYTQNFDQIKQTCQNFFTSFTEKIASDIQKTCFHQPSQQHKKDNTSSANRQPCSNVPPSPSYINSCPGTSGMSRSEIPSQRYESNASPQSSNNQNDCECCSDDEIAEISEKCHSILNSESKDSFINAKKAKLENSSSDSSFEEVTNKQSDDDWQIVDGVKNGDDNEENKKPNDDTQLPSSTKCTRRKSDSSLLNLRKSIHVDTLNYPLRNNEIRNIKISCKKCGKSKPRIKDELLKLNEQLQSSNRSENEISAKIKEFIEYLDTRLEPNDSAEASSNVTGGPSSSDQNSESNMDENGLNAEGATVEDIKDEKPSCSFDPSKRFITLDDIQSSADLEYLSVKQLKELLALNRVNFKGCCEKNELKERVLRLWESYVNSPSSDKLSSNDLCKICMDAPIECVFLECGHTATCTACGKVLSECPICRSYIVRVVRIFKS